MRAFNVHKLVDHVMLDKYQLGVCEPGTSNADLDGSIWQYLGSSARVDTG